MINCLIIDDDEMSRKLTESFVQKTDFLNLAQSFPDAVSALSFLSSNSTDLIFLDIEMPEMDGIEFICTIQHKMPQVVLTTSHREFAPEAFEYNVTDYLVKPFDYARFCKAALKAKEIYDKQTLHHVGDDSVFVKKGASMVRIRISEILWVEALGDYITFQTEKEKLVIHSTMASMESKLPQSEYMRVHRSYIVRLDRIDRIEDQTIYCQGKEIPIGKSYREEVLKRLTMF